MTPSIEKLRKGGLADINDEYANSIVPPSFMSGPHRKDYNLRMACTWEPYHEAFVNVYYNYSSINDEQLNRTANFLLGDKISLGITLSYGL